MWRVGTCTVSVRLLRVADPQTCHNTRLQHQPHDNVPSPLSGCYTTNRLFLDDQWVDEPSSKASMVTDLVRSTVHGAESVCPPMQTVHPSSDYTMASQMQHRSRSTLYKVHWLPTLFLPSFSVLPHQAGSSLLPSTVLNTPPHSLRFTSSLCPWLDPREFLIIKNSKRVFAGCPSLKVSLNKQHQQLNSPICRACQESSWALLP